jgi:hypothetical protein
MSATRSIAAPPRDHGDLRHYEPKRRRALDLVRFMEQDRYLFRRKQAFIAYVERKVRRRRYNPAEGPTLWSHWLKEGLIRYLRTHPRVDGLHYTDAFLHELAQEIAEREHARVVRGDYVDMTVDGTVGPNGRPHVVRW